MLTQFEDEKQKGVNFTVDINQPKAIQLRRVSEARAKHAEFARQYNEILRVIAQQNFLINQETEEGDRILKEQIFPAIEAKYVRLGQHGSSGWKRDRQQAEQNVMAERNTMTTQLRLYAQ